MKITVYTTTDCQFSKQEKEYLASHNLQYEEKNLETNKEFLTEMLALSNNFAGTPVTRVEKDDGSIAVLKGFTKEEFDTTFGLKAATTDSTTPPPPQKPEETKPVEPPVTPPTEEKAAPPPPPVETPTTPPINEKLGSVLDKLEDKTETPTTPETTPPPAQAAQPPSPSIPDFSENSPTQPAPVKE